jgi:H+/Cl- antiporter ClcA
MKRNPVTLTGSVFLWAMLGIICGLFAASYWIFLSYMMVGFEYFSGLSLLIIMPLAGLLIHWLGNPGEIGLIIDNIHLNGGRLPMNENPSMILSSLISIASGGSAGPEAPMVQATGSIGTWLAHRFQLRGEALRTLSIAGMASGFTVLATLQSQTSRQVKCSNNQRKTYNKISRLHAQIACIRKDFLHKLTTYVSQDFQFNQD